MKRGTVPGSTALEPMTFHDSLKSMTFTGSLNINIHPYLKNAIERDILTQFILSRVNYPEFTNVVETCCTGLGNMPCYRLVDTRSFFLFKSDLNCIIAVSPFTLYLQHFAWTGLDNSHRNDITQFVKNPGHSDFFP